MNELDVRPENWHERWYAYAEYGDWCVIMHPSTRTDKDWSGANICVVPTGTSPMDDHSTVGMRLICFNGYGETRAAMDRAFAAATNLLREDYFGRMAEGDRLKRLGGMLEVTQRLSEATRE